MPSADDDAAHVLRIGGMTCGHCVGAVTSALEGVAGVARADVDLERGLATVAAAPGASLALADLVDAVEASGFDASDAAGGGGAATTQTLAVEGMSCGQCEASATTRAFADDDGVDVAGEERARKLARVAEVRAFRRRVAFARGAVRPRLRFYVGAFNSLRYGTANMDVLVALGTSAAYFYSIYVLYEALLSLQPKMATVSHTMDDGGDYEEVVDAGSLSRGDVVKIKPGEAVPRTAPSSAAMGTESLLASIVKLVEQAQGSKTQIEALADYVARNFVAGVVAVAVAAFALWFSLAATEAVPRDWYDDEGRLFAFLFSIAVLVVACPCALGLATPTAVMVGTGLGARYGVLIKGGRPLEVAHKVSAVVFDKTGTLTRGNRTCRPWTPATSAAQRRRSRLRSASRTTATAAFATLLDAVGVAERLGAPARVRARRHGRGGAGRRAGGARDSASSPSTRSSAGASPRRCARGRRRGAGLVLHVGTRDLVAAAGGGRGALGPERDARAKALEADGATVVFVHAAVGGRRLVADDFKATAKKPPPAGSGDVVGMIGVADIIRDEAARVVSHLQSNLGIEVWMLTGDGARPRPSRQCGISRVLAKVRPDDKARNVTSLMDQGHVVAMVGDGVNDFAGAAAADLGVAIGAGAQIAVETADVVLIRSVLDDVATAIEVRLPPEVAALAMVLSSVSVVASSLSLRSYKPPSASPRAGDGDPTLCSCAVRCCSVRFHCGADRAYAKL
ncbi:cation-transporting ATPase [Aureococcus anophagefferens]|nr:cation-transporting ATPase [Aureococcus anophagefferens]